MTPEKLTASLSQLIEQRLMVSTMIWGAPGIGKSSIVTQVGEKYGLPVIDVRLSQLAPTDLRGLPVAENGISRWYPPEFLPRDGAGILFLDELNLAPPVMQGMAQQLILDRRVGSYTVPDHWFIWAAGNRKEDRAAVFDMPAPLANRFVHFTVEVDLESFKAYALEQSVHEWIIAFLAFRPSLLHKLDPQKPAWPSPRSWMVADQFYKANLEIDSVIGSATTAEFESFTHIYEKMPDVSSILAGQGNAIAFPVAPDMRYALVTALSMRAQTINEMYSAYEWMTINGPAEWVQLFATDLFRVLQGKKQLGKFAGLIERNPKLREHLASFMKLIAETTK